MSAPSSGGASRDGYGKGLLRLASDPRVVVLEADLVSQPNPVTSEQSTRLDHSLWGLLNRT